MPRLSLKEFNKVYSKVPRLAVDLFIRKAPDYGILLTKRAITPFKGMWHFPGGTVLKEETIKQALKRIAKEELGIKVKIGKLLGYYEVFSDKHDIVLVFQAEVTGGELKINEQATDFGYFTGLPINTIPAHRRFYASI